MGEILLHPALRHKASEWQSMLGPKILCTFDHAIKSLTEINLEFQLPDVARAVYVCQTVRAILVDAGSEADLSRLLEFMRRLQTLLILVHCRARLARMMSSHAEQS